MLTAWRSSGSARVGISCSRVDSMTSALMRWSPTRPCRMCFVRSLRSKKGTIPRILSADWSLIKRLADGAADRSQPTGYCPAFCQGVRLPGVRPCRSPQDRLRDAVSRGEGEAPITLQIARECFEQLPNPGKKLVIFTKEEGGERHHTPSIGIAIPVMMADDTGRQANRHVSCVLRPYSRPDIRSTLHQPVDGPAGGR